jgi:hypothetical protein
MTHISLAGGRGLGRGRTYPAPSTPGKGRKEDQLPPEAIYLPFERAIPYGFCAHHRSGKRLLQIDARYAGRWRNAAACWRASRDVFGAPMSDAARAETLRELVANLTVHALNGSRATATPCTIP